MDAKEAGLIMLGVEANENTVGSFFSQFHCQKCGQCCTQGKSPTDGILLEPNEDARLAYLLNINLKKFKREHTFTHHGNRIMKYPCPFYKKECSIYSNRPSTCRYYPVGVVAITYGKGQLTLNPNCPEGRRLYTEAWKRNTKK